MARVRTSDIASSPRTAHRIEQRTGDGRGWDPVPGDATGWTLTGARRALRSWVGSLPIDDVADLYRIVREATGDEVERVTGVRLRPLPTDREATP